MKICGAPDCDRPVGNRGAKGYCPKHYKRLRSRGTVTFDFRATPAIRFERYRAKGASDQCWEWCGGRDQDGYGKFIVDDVPIRAHRFAWQLAHGQPAPKGSVVRHTCDNPPCVNPAHLAVGTVADNNADKTARGRARGNRTGNLGRLRRRLTAEQVAEIRAFGNPHRHARSELARRYGVTYQHVMAIQSGQRHA